MSDQTCRDSDLWAHGNVLDPKDAGGKLLELALHLLCLNLVAEGKFANPRA